MILGMFFLCFIEKMGLNNSFFQFIRSRVRGDAGECHRIRVLDKQFRISKCVFSKCQDFRGGAVYCGSETVWISQCLFTNNRANYGAGVYLAAIQSGLLSMNSFVNNFADNLCAGVMIDSNIDQFESVTINNSNFSGGVAPSVGAIDCWGGAQKISFCQIDHSNSTYAWPAVRISSTKSQSLLENTMFSDNFSRQKGCCVGLSKAMTKLKITACLFFNNRQLGANGTTIFTEESKCEVVLHDCQIFGEKERQFGKLPHQQWLTIINTEFIYDENKDRMKDTPAPTMSPYCHMCPMIGFTF